MAYDSYLTGMGKISVYEIEENHRWADRQHLADIARTANKDGYYVPRDVAETLCAEIRAETVGRWYTRQKWSCWRCMLTAQNGIPAGLARSQNDCYQCRAIVRRYGYVTP